MCSLFSAVINNDLFLLQEVLMEDPDIDVNKAVIGSLTALHVAAEKGYSSCAKILLSSGADVNVSDEHGVTPLMTAILAGCPLAVVALMKHPECDVNLHTHTSATALHFAARQGCSGIVQLLLQGGANPNVLTQHGLSPLSLAVQGGHTEVVKCLVYGCAYVDMSLAESPEMPLPLFETLKNCKFLLAKILLQGGYNCVNEISQFTKSLSVEAIADEEYPDSSQVTELLSSSRWLSPCCLSHLGRLSVRKCIGSDIWKKVNEINLPQQIRDFICFRDMWVAPRLETSYEIYNFFNDNAREVFELV